VGEANFNASFVENSDFTFPFPENPLSKKKSLQTKFSLKLYLISLHEKQKPVIK